MSPPESRSRVEYIKRRFEVGNNDISLSAKIPVNRNLPVNKTQSSNGTKSSASPRKKILHTATSNPIDIPRKFSNPSPSLKTPTSIPVRTERQLSNPYGKAHVRRSPAFRCDKIVRGRNVVGQKSGAPERIRSVEDSKVELFDDGQSVKSVIRKMNVYPIASSYMAAVASKSHRLQLQKQLALEEADTAKKVMTAIKLRNTVSTNQTKETPLVKNSSVCEKLGGKGFLNVGSRIEVSETVPQCGAKLAKRDIECASVSKVKAQELTPFFLKSGSRGLKLPFENKQSSSECTLENSPTVRNIIQTEVGLCTNLTHVLNGNKVNNLKGISHARNEEEVRPETLQEQASTNNTSLTDTLKAALKSPLPSGPPPKKPPRTFAHSIPHADNAGLHNVSMPNSIDAVSNKDLSQHVQSVKTSSEETNVLKTVKPVRSKTESQIMLKKLESVLLNHQQGNGGVVLRPRSPLAKRNIEDSEVDSDTGKPLRRMGPLPSLPLKSELPHSRETIPDGDNAISGGCLNLNCISVSSNNPLRSQIHFYEKIPEKQSEFFVESPKNHLQSRSLPKPCGLLLHCRSRSEEHIYAEPFDYLNNIHICKHVLQDGKSPWNVMKGGESVGDLSKIGACAKEFETRTSASLSPKSVTSRMNTLHYLVSNHCVGTVNFAVLGVQHCFTLHPFFVYLIPVHTIT
jgi:hypothetical protein